MSILNLRGHIYLKLIVLGINLNNKLSQIQFLIKIITNFQIIIYNNILLPH